MKRLFLSLIICLCAAAQSWAAVAANWKLQDNAASTVIIASNGANAVYTNAGNTSAGTALDGPGTVLTRSLVFDGTNDYVLATTNNAGVLQNKAAGTLCCWFKCSTSDTTSTHRLMYVSTNTNTTRAGFQLNSSGQIEAHARAGDGESFQTKTTTNSYDDGTWHHVAVVYDYANDAITIYVDGTSVAQTGTISFTATATSNTASAYVYLANDTSSFYYKGRACGFVIYNTDESANLTAIIDAKDTDDISSNLVLHIPCQDNAASTTVDATVGTDGTLTNAGNTSASSVSGPGGSIPLALSFDGTNDYAEFATGNGTIVRSVGNWSVSLWFKSTSAALSTLFSATTTSTSTWRAGLSMPAGGLISTAGRSTNAGSVYGRQTTASFNDGNWHHVVGVANIPSDTVEIFIDGTYITSTTLTNGTIAWTTVVTDANDSAAIRIARYATGQHFDGDVADVRVYQRCLIANEANALYALGLSSGTAPFDGVTFPLQIGQSDAMRRFISRTPTVFMGAH